MLQVRVSSSYDDVTCPISSLSSRNSNLSESSGSRMILYVVFFSFIKPRTRVLNSFISLIGNDFLILIVFLLCFVDLFYLIYNSF